MFTNDLQFLQMITNFCNLQMIRNFLKSMFLNSKKKRLIRPAGFLSSFHLRPLIRLKNLPAVVTATLSGL